MERSGSCGLLVDWSGRSFILPADLQLGLGGLEKLQLLCQHQIAFNLDLALHDWEKGKRRSETRQSKARISD